MAATYTCRKWSTILTTKNRQCQRPLTLFTPDNQEHHFHPPVKLADHVLSLEKKPNVLGVMLTTHLTITQHKNNFVVNVQQRNNVLKALAGSTWG